MLGAIIITLVSTIVATIMIWRPRAARALFLLSAAGWAIVAAVDTVGVVVKWTGEETAPAGSNPLSAVLNLLLVVSPVLPLLAATYMSGRSLKQNR